MRFRAAFALLIVGTGAGAGVADNPAAQCAALWEGYARHADQSAYLDGARDARAEAREFRDEAVAETGDAAGVDAYIDREAPGRRLMVEAYVYSGDEMSQDILERAMTRCGGE